MIRVKILRREVGFKQKDLALLLGINRNNYVNIENGKLIPNSVKETEKRAIKILKPLLSKKLIAAQEEVERLEILIIQYK